MPSASLAVVRRVHPQPVRITALSAAIAVNLAVILIALRPMAPRIAEAIDTTPVPTVRLITPPVPVKPPPPIVLPHPTPAIALPRKTAAPPRAVPQTSEGDVHTPSVTTPTLAPPSKTIDTAPTAKEVTAQGEISLAYRSSPLRFPTQALRRHMQGTVLLRVLVDESGKPVDVQIEQSSGYSLLDQSAREKVLAGWQFQPAEVDGHPSRAWARVPVSFVVNAL